MKAEGYLGELSTHLQARGLTESRIQEVVVEVATHLTESGEDPVESFGPADEFAERMAVDAEVEKQRVSGDRWYQRTFRATAIDEMGILAHAGRDGWELMDVGAYALFCRRPMVEDRREQWEYVRRVGIDQNGIIEEMIADRWQPCGHWIVFHYFKRQIRAAG